MTRYMAIGTYTEHGNAFNRLTTHADVRSSNPVVFVNNSVSMLRWVRGRNLLERVSNSSHQGHLRILVTAFDMEQTDYCVQTSAFVCPHLL